MEVKSNIQKSEDRVSHPKHYTWLKDKCGIEVIDITRHMDFNLGNSLKYILRSGHKSEEGYTNSEKQIEDLKKAIWYLNDEIKMLEAKPKEVIPVEKDPHIIECDLEPLDDVKKFNKGLKYVTKFF